MIRYTLPALLTGFLGILSPGSASAEIGALMSAGAAFIGADDVNQIAEELNFDSMSPGIDGGVLIRFGRIERGLSGSAGIAVVWIEAILPVDDSSGGREKYAAGYFNGVLVSEQGLIATSIGDGPNELDFFAKARITAFLAMELKPPP